MTQNGSQEGSGQAKNRSRRDDRRCRSRVSPPPYPTSEGEVQTDRRSYLDRRSTWIRDFFIEHGEPDKH